MNSATKIKIKCTDIKNNTKTEILNVFENFYIKCSKLSNNNQNELFALLHCDSDADKIFDARCTKALRAIDCVPIMPAKIKTLRSILIKRVEKEIYDCDVEDIHRDLRQSNANFEIVDIFKFPNARIIKITLLNQEMANNCLQLGIKLFKRHLSPSDMQKEEVIDIKICYRCYELDSHLAHECSKPDTYKICSTCSSENHTYVNCTSDSKMCINCQQPHSTMSFSCSKRKAIVKNQRSNSSTGTSQNYAEAVKVRPISGHVPAPTGNLDYTSIQDSIVKSVMCMIVASVKERESPGCFHGVMETLQNTNNVPHFNLGDIRLPENFISHFSQQQMSSPSVDVTNSSNHNVTLNEPLNNTENKKKSSDEKRLSSLKISISKSKTCPTITSVNFSDLLKKRLIQFDDTSGLSEEQCVKELQNDLLKCKDVISRAKARDFRKNNL